MRKIKNGWTALHGAAPNGCEGIVRSLLERGTEIDANHEEEGWCSMRRAWSGYDAIVRLLLEREAERR